MVSPVFSIVVTRGLSAGARLLVDASPKAIGRARDADLVLRDALVSRQHVRVSSTEEGARVDVCDGAKDVLVNGASTRSAVLREGDVIVIGETPLLVQTDRPRAPSDVADELARTDVRTLMTGVAADVRGLATVMALVEALDATTDRDSVLEAVRGWSSTHLACERVALASPEDDASLGAESPATIVERFEVASGVTSLSAPVATATATHWLTFAFSAPPTRIPTTTRRLAAVAARVVVATLTRAQALERAEDDRDTFRRVALGSARSFLGDSRAALEVAKLVPRLSASEASVLIEGETGVGKTFLARLIHDGGARAKEPLRVLNCAALPDTLVESELFGHERGAFTGAVAARQGALESAGSGTILLDEIGEIPLATQAKLLRVLEERRFERLGSNRSLTLKARVIAATNRDLPAMIRAGTFREDLFYRIAVVRLRVPPLRDRGDDLVLLARRILEDLLAHAPRRIDGLSPAAIETIRGYAWPGNVRELKNALERALVVGDGRFIEPADFPEALRGAAPPQPADEGLVRLPASLEVLEARAIAAALRATNGNQSAAATLLGISRNTLRRKLHPERSEPTDD